MRNVVLKVTWEHGWWGYS